MTKDDFLIKAVLSLNAGADLDVNIRVATAVKQYESLKKQGVKFEDDTVNKTSNSYI